MTNALAADALGAERFLTGETVSIVGDSALARRAGGLISQSELPAVA